MDSFPPGQATRAPPRAIAIACDDFGLDAGIDRAALHLARRGRVQAIGCLVGGPTWPHHAQWLQTLDAAEVDLGLHLDLTAAPLTLGRRRSLPALVLSALAGRLDGEALRREIRAQMAVFERALGRPPAYVDGHQHVHQLPQVREALLDELQARWRACNAPRPWLRSARRPRRGLHALRGERPAALKAWVIERLGAAGLAALAARAGFAQNRHLLGVYLFEADPARHAQRLRRWLEQAQHADLLMCHPADPGPPDPPAPPSDALAEPLWAARRVEAALLDSADFAALLLQQQVVLRPMSQLLGQRPRRESLGPVR